MLGVVYVDLTGDRLENICLKRVLRATAAVEFGEGGVGLVLTRSGFVVSLPIVEGDMFEELLGECRRGVEYRFYSECPKFWYGVLLSRAARVESYGPVPRVFHYRYWEGFTGIGFGEKDGERHVILHSGRAIVHFVMDERGLECIEDCRGDCGGEVTTRYYVDEDYVVDWLKRYLKIVGSVEARPIGGKGETVRLMLQNVDRVMRRKWRG